ncbi:chemotaxis protein CheW [Dermatophilus congolensis]|uniref:chemotaxis protein CheW n=1 Tax=Dermatophilus congolensis TaxID=1863 RepID=UPI001AAEE8D6|nr:chemotaxis protein CheW [Dermatophilus congolensis]MBO3143409.1 hypothetical protein [Dermatophilus congolensis]MBO3152399.1 hypothetical protein [Dermatophilus congolensis]MBO3160590.1 hypothetical protein [Dermatophilus congolensis]MBO3163687.1 hypothetical protein [Dermatophilus congolensis]MBO3177233.1 hypothetical protein [Dermatophilus congolensis]
MEGMEEIVQEFLVESHENLDQLDQDLLALEQDPTSRDLLSSIFRTLHTIKGTAGFLALHTLEKVAHAGESLLSKLRDGEMTLNPAMTTVLLEMVDAVRALLENIENEGSEGTEEYHELRAKLHAILDGQDAQAVVDAAKAGTLAMGEQTTAPAAATEASADAAPTEAAGAAEAEVAVAVAVATATSTPAGSDTAPPAAEVPAQPEQLPAEENLSVTQAAAVTAAQDAAKAAAEAQAQAAADAQTPQAAAPEAGKPAPKVKKPDENKRSVADSSIRVDVDLLDSLVNLVGELVLARNQAIQHAARSDDPELVRSMHQLSLVASEVQEGVMKTRMQPIDHVWRTFPRVVRDLATSLGRQIRVEFEGKETELDKTILEAIKDPLTHLVRNSCDHGIEPPDVRQSRGKDPEGVLTMRAYHEGGQVNIEIIDDGAGINVEKVKAKAVEKGLITRDDAEKMSDRDANHLIFRPGFSTADKVSNVSGRGVGMDVVKTNIEKIGGTIDVTSTFGEGTTTRIKIPLTLAIIPALLVRGQDNMFAIPQVNLLELVRLDAAQAAERLETIQGTPVYRLRGDLLPLVYLREQLNIEPSDSDTTFIAVLRADQQRFGLVVDDIEDTEEIVVKPLGKQMRGIDLYSGATLMGDGRVALILDTMALANASGMVSEGSEFNSALEEARARDAKDSASLLVVRLSTGRRVALPLKVVERLEEFPISRIETVGQNQVVQYRGVILPLLRLADDYGSYDQVDADKPLQVVVCQYHGQLFGFVVDQVLDIVEDELAIRTHLDTGGNLGSAVVDEHVTELLNIDTALAGMVAPEPGDLGAYAGGF